MQVRVLSVGPPTHTNIKDTMVLQRTIRVAFNPNLKDHRNAVIAFMKRNAWVDTSYRFVLEQNYESVADQVKDQLLKWYVEHDV